MSSVSNAFTLIKLAVANQADGLSFTEILEFSELPRSSVHRLLKELTSLSVLSYDADTKTYRGGILLAALGAQVTSNFDVRQSSRPALKALHDALGSVVTLSICGEDSGIYIDKIEAQDFGLRLHSEIGKSFPLHCTAMGKVHLAYGDDALLERVIALGLAPHTKKTITKPGVLQTELKRVRELGYAVDDEEISRGLTCIGAPIFGLNGEVIAALSLTTPSHVYENGIPERVINAVIAAAQEASLN